MLLESPFNELPQVTERRAWPSVLFSTAIGFTSGIRCPGSGISVMTAERFLPKSPLPASPARFNRGSTAQSLLALEQRLASAERELRVQFIRIAQLQAELDLLLAERRRCSIL
jgi:hypothetical protein